MEISDFGFWSASLSSEISTISMVAISERENLSSAQCRIFSKSSSFNMVIDLFTKTKVARFLRLLGTNYRRLRLGWSGKCHQSNDEASQEGGQKVNPVEITILPLVNEFLDESDEEHRHKAPESHLEHQAAEGSDEETTDEVIEPVPPNLIQEAHQPIPDLVDKFFHVSSLNKVRENPLHSVWHHRWSHPLP